MKAIGDLLDQGFVPKQHPLTASRCNGVYQR